MSAGTNIIPGTGGMNQYQYEKELIRKLNAGQTVNADVARAAGYGDIVDSYYSHFNPTQVSQGWKDSVPESGRWDSGGGFTPANPGGTAIPGVGHWDGNNFIPNQQTGGGVTNPQAGGFSIEDLIAKLKAIFDGQMNDQANKHNQALKKLENQNNYLNSQNQWGGARSGLGGVNADFSNTNPRHESGARIGVSEDGKARAISRYLMQDMWANKGGQ